MKVKEILSERKPNLAIFRLVDDEDGNKVFIQVRIDGHTIAAEGQVFGIDDPTDNYNQMDFDHVVLAEETVGGSIDLCRFQIADGDKRAVVFAMEPSDRAAVISTLVKDYNALGTPK